MTDRVIDLDAARAARAETTGPAPSLLLGGQTFTLPAELPFAFGVALATGRVDEALRVLVDGQADAVYKLGLTMADWAEILGRVPAIYGFGDDPESSASPASSPKGGKRPRQTSKRTTS